MDNKKSIRERLESVGIEDNMIDEILPLIVSEQEPVSNGLYAVQQEEAALQASMSAEPDWRKRAAIAARIISLNLGP